MIQYRPVIAVVILAFAISACTQTMPESGSETHRKATATVQAKTPDGITIYGEKYYGTLSAKTPLVLLFHQGGSNGRAEYAELAAWLNDAGFRAIAWDQRSGGELYGKSNRTKAGLASDYKPGYCDAYVDMQTALDFVRQEKEADKVIVWGSSYSAALVFRLAAENPTKIYGVVAMSPASGGPMRACHAGMWADAVQAPVLAMNPATEMTRDSTIEQQRVLKKAGVKHVVINNGIHGSSMLVDERTKHDMSEARQMVSNWLKATFKADLKSRSNRVY